MAELQDELFSIIGSTLKDEYGHEIGRVISITTTPSSRVKEVLVSSKGEFLSYPRERIKINENGEPVLLAEVKLKTNVLCSEIPLVWKKCEVLENLLSDGKILPETYKEFHEQFESEKEKLKSEAEKTIEEIEKLEKSCDERFRRLQSSKIHLEIEYAIGKIKEEIYELSMKDLVNELDSIMKERNDLENMRKWLSNILLGESTVEVQEEKPEETQIHEPEQEAMVEEQKPPEVEVETQETQVKPAEETSSDESSITVRII